MMHDERVNVFDFFFIFGDTPLDLASGRLARFRSGTRYTSNNDPTPIFFSNDGHGHFPVVSVLAWIPGVIFIEYSSRAAKSCGSAGAPRAECAQLRLRTYHHLSWGNIRR